MLAWAVQRAPSLAVRRPGRSPQRLRVPFLFWIVIAAGAASAADAAADFTGRWRSNFGLVELVQEGAQVNGTYSCCDGVIAGQVDEASGRLTFRWQDPTYGRGWGWFQLIEDGQAMEGAWGADGTDEPAGEWNAARVRAASVAGEPSYWRVKGREPPAGQISGVAELNLDGERLEGKLVLVYLTEFQGEPRRVEVTDLLQGQRRGKVWHIQWENVATGRRGGMKLAEQGRRLSGAWWAHKGRDYGLLTLTPTARTGFAADSDERGDRRIRSEARIAGTAHLTRGVDAAGQSRWSEAAAAFGDAVNRFEAAGDTEKLAEALLGLGQVQQATGAFDDAKRSLCRVFELGSEVSTTNRDLAEAGLTMLWVELIPDPSLAEGPLDLCAAIPGDAMKQSSVAVADAMTPSRPASQATARSEAVAMLFDRRPGDAVAHLSEALARAADLRDLYGSPFAIAEQIDEAATLVILAEAQRRVGDLAAAAATLEQVAGLYQGPLAKVGGAVNLTTTQISLALVLAEQGDAAAAERLLSATIARQRGLALPRQWVSWLILARLYRDEARRDEAAAALDAAIELVEAQRGAIDDVPLRIGYFAQAVEPYLARIDLLLDGSPSPASQREALDLSERARARTFLDTLAAPDRDAPDDTVHFRPLTHDEIGAHVRAGSARYLSYFVTDTGVYAWVLEPTGEMHFRQLPIAPVDLRRRTAMLRGRLEREDLYTELSRELFQVLIEPLLPLLADLPADGRLTIVPHGVLNMLPFDALSADGKRFWALNYQVSYLPSLSALAALPRYRFCAGDRLLAVAADDPEDPLPYAAEEATRVAQLFGDRATRLIGDASPEMVLDASEAHAFMLFATHARVEPGVRDATRTLEHPGRFSLQLAAGEHLTTRDIEGLNLKPGLVALSACDTHLGPRVRGDELMTLSRAFLSAGMSSVLATLWRVEDEATAQIVSGFFAALARGAEPAAALREAQRAYRSGGGLQHPRYWAPWVVVGGQAAASSAAEPSQGGCRGTQ